MILEKDKYSQSYISFPHYINLYLPNQLHGKSVYKPVLPEPSFLRKKWVAAKKEHLQKPQ